LFFKHFVPTSLGCHENFALLVFAPSLARRDKLLHITEKPQKRQPFSLFLLEDCLKQTENANIFFDMTVIYTFRCCYAVLPKGESFPKPVAETGQHAVLVESDNKNVRIKIGGKIATIPKDVAKEILARIEIKSVA